MYVALGVILLILFSYFGVTVSKNGPEEKGLQPANRKDKAVLSLKFLFSTAIVIAIFKFTVESGVNIAEFLGVSPSVIGAISQSNGSRNSHSSKERIRRSLHIPFID